MALTAANLQCLHSDEIQRTFQASPSQVTTSTKTWHSDTDSDPTFQDPTHRLRRYKSTVAAGMRSLYYQGPEGIAVLRHDELLFRGWHDPVMKNGTRLPEDIEFWKAKELHFTKEWARIEAKKNTGKKPVSTMYGPTADRINAWIPDPKPAVDDQVQLPEHQRTLRSGISRKRGQQDASDVNMPPPKRRKSEHVPVPQAKLQEGQPRVKTEPRSSTPSRTQRGKPCTTKESITKHARQRSIATQRVTETRAQPLRRSPRIAARNARIEQNQMSD
ncbi:hypothetical protein B0T10DRAFT_141220 [Thelonectria olida]|uniref:Uncharacterized protein n=1 Tax=Thelonectria olida TaxID=1576542 RepID=A0A9P9ALJ8_9HYPO|nr:hypothetical protein B0T10DRAFT_141220 [Thelonectria olida]